MRSALVFVAALSGCIESDLTLCDDGTACPVHAQCLPGGGCATAAQLAACSGVVDFEPCAIGAIPDGVCVSQICIRAGCGNSVIEPGEACDDGNTIGSDACRQDCLSDNTCGNGVIDPERGEQCDDGNSANDDACHTDCKLPRCGDSIVDSGEVCDDGNLDSIDKCRIDCLSDNTCGNGVVDVLVGEGCDCGTNASSLPVGCTTANSEAPGALCRSDCQFAGCGDGLIELPEDCEGTDLDGKTCLDVGYYGGNLACRSSCRFEVGACVGRCGDSIVNGPEQCDGAQRPLGCGELGLMYDRPACTVACNAQLLSCDSATPRELIAAEPVPPLKEVSVDSTGTLWGISLSDHKAYEIRTTRMMVVHDIASSDESMRDIAVLAPDDIYVIDGAGSVFHYDGMDWTQIRTGGLSGNSSIGINADGTDVYAIEENVIERYNGAGSWTRIDGGLPLTLWSDAITCGGHLVVYGSGAIARYDNPGWTNLVVNGYGVDAICESGGIVHLVGGYGSGTQTVRYEVNNAQIKEALPMPQGSDGLLNLNAIDTRMLFANGSAKGDYVFAGRRWVRLSQRHYATPFSLINAIPKNGDVGLIENTGRLSQANAVVVDYGKPAAFSVSATALWEVFNTELRQNGRAVAAVPVNSKVWAAENGDAFTAVGSAISVCTSLGCASPVTPPNAMTTFRVVRGTSGTDAYAVDGTNKLWRLSGTTWTQIGLNVWDIVIVGPGAAYALVANQIFELIGTSFTLRATTGTNLLAIGKVSATDYIAVGDGGGVVRGAGANWAPDSQALTTVPLRWVTVAGSRIFVFGANGVALQRDATGWIRANFSSVETSVTEYAGTSDGGLWLYGVDGLIELLTWP